jgi:restriction system protein
MDMVAMLPWWGGVLLAVAAYLGLHQVATTQAPALAHPAQMGPFVIAAMYTAAARIGQYILPILCLAGAGVSYWRRRHRGALVSGVAQSKAADALDGMTWREFEMLVSEAFRLQGYRVLENGGDGPDGGVDLVLTKGNEKYLVQCKQWKAFKVGVDVVRELYGVMAAGGAAGGFVVTSGTFTADAKEFADGRNVTLADGPRLLGLIKDSRASLAATQPTRSSAATAVPTREPSAPRCPACGSEMVKRTARKGSKAGSQFWGCSKFPACNGTRTMG